MMCERRGWNDAHRTRESDYGPLGGRELKKTTCRPCRVCLAIMSTTFLEAAAQRSTHAACGLARAAAAGPGWCEYFINRQHARATKGVAEAVACSHSVLVLDSLATSDECAALTSEGSRLAREELHERAMLEECGLLDDTMDHDAGRVRMHVRDRLGRSGQAICDLLLVRALRAIDRMDGAAASFGRWLATTHACLEDDALLWSPGEPAVNVYAPGGEFKPHEDEQMLSILVPLTDGADFSGGGTAFWRLDSRGQEDEQAQRSTIGEPELVLVPPAGAAIIFGGQLTHAALPVLAGERCILVGSCSPSSQSRTYP
jgi:hypothetical protein